MSEDGPLGHKLTKKLIGNSFTTIPRHLTACTIAFAGMYFQSSVQVECLVQSYPLSFSRFSWALFVSSFQEALTIGS